MMNNNETVEDVQLELMITQALQDLERLKEKLRRCLVLCRFNEKQKNRGNDSDNTIV